MASRRITTLSRVPPDAEAAKFRGPHPGPEDAVVFEGPAPGPAGDVGTRVDDGFYVRADVADPRIVTAVWFDLSVGNDLALARMLGTAAARAILDGETNEVVVDTGDNSLLDVAVRLALAQSTRLLPLVVHNPGLWAVEAALLLWRLHDEGFRVGDLLAGEVAAAAPALARLAVLPRDQLRKEGNETLVAALHIARDILDPDSPAWEPIATVCNDLPDERLDLAAHLDGSGGADLLLAGSRSGGGQPVFLGEGAPSFRGATGGSQVRTAIVWLHLPTRARPGAAFSRAVTLQTSGSKVQVSVDLLPPRPDGVAHVYVRVIRRATGDVAAVDFAPHLGDGKYEQSLDLGVDFDESVHRVEIVESLAARVLDESMYRKVLGEQWAQLALQSERRGTRGTAATRWRAAAEQYAQAGDTDRERTARAYAQDDSADRPAAAFLAEDTGFPALDEPEEDR